MSRHHHHHAWIIGLLVWAVLGIGVIGMPSESAVAVVRPHRHVVASTTTSTEPSTTTTTEEPTTTTTVPVYVAPRPVTPPVTVAPTGDAFEQLRNCESGGNYAIDTGNGFYGAYQFTQSTWDGAVARAGFPQYSGQSPASAPPAVQDAAARQLQAERGWQPWPTCGARL